MIPPVLFIGGMDSSGGAGILRDTATAAALGAPVRVAVTAVTAQSDRAVRAVHLVPPETVSAQIALAAQEPLGAVKIGMLGCGHIVEAVADALPDVPVVLDPVLQSSSGRDLIDRAGIRALLDRLLPRTTLLTPNLPELERLRAQIGLPTTVSEAAIVHGLQQLGCGAVLVKGGHSTGPDCEDRLYLADGSLIFFRHPRLGASLRGTGCQLASAIAVHLAQGAKLHDAVQRSSGMMQDRFRATVTAAR